MKPFLWRSNVFCNIIRFLPRTGSYFEILIVWSKTESIIKLDSFPRCCYFWYNTIDRFKCVIYVWFIHDYFNIWVWWENATLRLIILCFLNSAAKAVTNLNPLNSFSRFFNLFLTIAHLVFLSCISGLKECKVSRI